MSTVTTTTPVPSRGWTIALWIAQVALAAMYGMAGYNKLFLTPDALVQMGMGFVADTPLALVRFIGVAETLGTIGILLPAATRILPGLTPLAALGLAAIQVLAIPLHMYRGEFAIVPLNLVLLAIALFVVWGRTRKAPIAARG